MEKVSRRPVRDGIRARATFSPSVEANRAPTDAARERIRQFQALTADKVASFDVSRFICDLEKSAAAQKSGNRALRRRQGENRVPPPPTVDAARARVAALMDGMDAHLTMAPQVAAQLLSRSAARTQSTYAQLQKAVGELRAQAAPVIADALGPVVERAKERATPGRIAVALAVPVAMVGPMFSGAAAPDAATGPAAPATAPLPVARMVEELEQVRTEQPPEGPRTVQDLLAGGLQADSQSPASELYPILATSPAAPTPEALAKKKATEVFQTRLLREPTEEELLGVETMHQEGEASLAEVSQVVERVIDESPEAAAVEVIVGAYGDAFGREPTSEEAAELKLEVMEQAQSGASPDALREAQALALKETPQWRQQVVAADYQEVLGRPAEASNPEVQAMFELAETLAAQGQGPDEVRAAVGAEIQQRAQIVTLGQLLTIMPRLDPARAQQLLPHLNAAMKEFNINTPQRSAAWLAQLAHESAEFRYFREIGCYEKRYAPFCGRGAIQVTWEDTYRQASFFLFGDDRLIQNPDLAMADDIVFRISGWWWVHQGNLNPVADINTDESFGRMSKRINGGTNGWDERFRYWRIAKPVMGA